MQCYKAIAVVPLLVSLSLTAYVAHADDPPSAPEPAKKETSTPPPAKKEAGTPAPAKKAPVDDKASAGATTSHIELNSIYAPVPVDSRVKRLRRMHDAIINDLDNADDVQAFEDRANSYESTAELETFYNGICRRRDITC
ncbi:MAG: hypothetical protein ABSH33_08010 [Steroidobacteraceae bacterium]|jgi:hypothetical protein